MSAGEAAAAAQDAEIVAVEEEPTEVDTERAFHLREAEALSERMAAQQGKAEKLDEQAQAARDAVVALQAEIDDHIEKAGA